jgi:glucose/arabinose dehydrogenase/mono/diheme cytochrome c family protein
MICFRCLVVLTVLVLGFLSTAPAQQGDKKGEVQSARVPKEKIPPAPPLAPEESRAQFKLQPGFRIELVASEPMVQNPIVMQFDPNGRLWVIEMRGFMPTADGDGETNPVAQVSILEDTDGDGRMDRKKVFLDGLVMPRALLLVEGGVLVCVPPQLWFYPNQNDAPGPRVLVAEQFAKEANPALGRGMNVEHSGNSLLRNLDNWIYSLYHPYRYRFQAGQWLREPIPQRAQWGLAQDDFGRMFYTANSDHLRADLVPPNYFTTAASKQRFPGIAIQISRDQTVWPARVNPGVNRGYQPDVLRPDGTLHKFTAACGTAIYRGDLFPPEFYGNAFVCEPAGNLIRRDVLEERDGVVSGRNPYPQGEFLASRDELFRPVNLTPGPDGALYIADMYHGIIQHRIYVTSYLRQQAEDRGLQKVVDRGRIWRVVPEGKSPRTQPTLASASSAELVKRLADPNGWWRDTAQRLLVERGDLSVVPALRQLLAGESSPTARLHALWTMEGLRQIEKEPALVDTALQDPFPKVRAAGIRLTEIACKQEPSSTAGAWRARLVKLAADSSPEVQVQAALTLGLNVSDPAAREALAVTAKSSPTPLAKDLASFTLARLEPAKATPEKKAGSRPLSPEEQKRFEAGKAMYEATCLACHQAHGLGQPGLAPPLLESEWVASSDARLIRIVLHGLRGPIKVKGEAFELDMPSLGVLDDDQIAAVLTYVRREWGHSFEPVTPARVKQVRDETANREDAWTSQELSRF